MLRIGKQVFRWRYFNQASKFTRTSIPANVPDRRTVATFPGTELDLKYACPLFSFREGSSKAHGTQNNYIQGILADFDHIPDGYDNFDQLFDDLKVRFPDAVVFRTPRGKVKVCWFVRAYRQEVADAVAVEFLNGRIPDLLPFVDTSSAALRVAFLDVSALECFAEFFATWGTEETYIQDLPGQVVEFSAAAVSDHAYHMVALESLPTALADILGFASMGVPEESKPAFANLFCVLAACPALLREEGMGLSSTILAKQLGVAQSTVSRWLKGLCDAGLIRWVGNKAVAGVKAKHYTAKHLALINAIETLSASAPRGKGGTGTLSSVVSSNLAQLGPTHQFRQKVSYWAAQSAVSFDELCEELVKQCPDIFHGNRRKAELRSCYKGALKKVAG